MEEFDPILVEVMKNEFIALVEEMAYTVQRTTRSYAAREGNDFNTNLLDADGRLIARASQGTWYVPNTMPWVLEKFGGRLREGDIVISNDPYQGGTHLPDIIIVMPVFWESEVIGFVGSAIHHTDIGGRVAGGMGATSTEIFEEGLRLPVVLLYDGGKAVDSVFDIIKANTRTPDDVLGDINGQVAGCWTAGRALIRLVEKYGSETVRAYSSHLIDYTERQIRNAVRSIPDGTYTADELIGDGGAGGAPVRILLTLRIEGDVMTVDFTGSNPQVPSAINVPSGTVRGFTVQDFGLLFDLVDVPANAGLLSPIQIIAEEGSILNPRFPAAMGARHLVSTPLRQIFFRALAQAVPDRVPAAGVPGAGIMIYTPDADGTDSSMLFDLWTGNGTGARPRLDGPDNPSGARIPAEVMEQDSPIILEGFGFAPDTGGAGKFRGSLATYRKWRFLKPGRLYVRDPRVQAVPYGLAGGKSGTSSRVSLTSNGRTTEFLETITETRVLPGDVLLHVMVGPGGHGDPMERDPEKVREDVYQEKLTPDYAQAEYGVAIDPVTLEVDHERTLLLRAGRRDSSPGGL